MKEKQKVFFQDVADLLAAIAMTICLFVLAGAIAGCSQGFEFKVGIGTYNQAHETRGYVEPVKAK